VSSPPSPKASPNRSGTTFAGAIWRTGSSPEPEAAPAVLFLSPSLRRAHDRSRPEGPYGPIPGPPPPLILEAGRGLTLSGISSSWQLPGGLDPGIETAWISLAPTDHELRAAVADTFYPDAYDHAVDATVLIPTGTEYYGELLVESVIGTHATTALGLTSTSTAGLGGNIAGSGGTPEAQGGILNGNFSLTALDLTASIAVPGVALPTGITAMGNLDLRIEYDQTAGSLKTGLNTDFTLDPALGGPGFVAVGGAVGYSPISV